LPASPSAEYGGLVTSQKVRRCTVCEHRIPERQGLQKCSHCGAWVTLNSRAKRRGAVAAKR
jgi:predicted RNA-binding Zn-ribbon protein involved in translation (DUF1610 family)